MASCVFYYIQSFCSLDGIRFAFRTVNVDTACKMQCNIRTELLDSLQAFASALDVSYFREHSDVPGMNGKDLSVSDVFFS